MTWLLQVLFTCQEMARSVDPIHLGDWMTIRLRVFARAVRLAVALRFVLLAFFPFVALSATLPGSARIEIDDPTGGLGWNSTNQTMTVQCWFKLSVPSGTTLTTNMTILVNRRTGNESSPSAFLIRYNVNNGKVEYLARGTSGAYTNTLIGEPYLERWYQVAITRDHDNFAGYVDGRPAFSGSSPVGNSANVDGVSIGGWGAGSYIYGSVQEVSIYQSIRSQSEIADGLYADQPTNLTELVGYYKLAYSTNASATLKNSSPNPPSNTAVAVALGAATFDELDQAGEQSAFDSRRNGGSDSVAPLSGAFSWGQTLLSRPTPGIAFDFRMAYSSGNALQGSLLGTFDPFANPHLGLGWRHTFEIRVIPGQYFDPNYPFNSIGLMMWDGAIETWDLNLTNLSYATRHKEYRGELSLQGTSNAVWVTPERLIYRFASPHYATPSEMRGRLLEIQDYNGNSVKVQWDTTRALITQVVDSAGGMYVFQNDNTRKLLTNLVFQGWSASLVYDVSNSPPRLISKTISGPPAYPAVNTMWQFGYDPTNRLLKRVIDPRGITNTTVSYDKYGRTTNVVDAVNRTLVTAYGSPGARQITRTDPANFSWIETRDRKGRVVSQTDPLGNVTSSTYDERGNRTSVTEPLGWRTTFGYDSRANVTAVTNELGQVRRSQYHPEFNVATNTIDPVGWATRYAYDTKGNLLNVADNLGTLSANTYYSNGLLQASADANGNTSTFAYDSSGFLISRTDPATNTWTYVRNELGWVMSESDPASRTATYGYDVNGNVLTVTDPLLRTLVKTYDANGNLLSQSNAKGQYAYFSYDAANQRTQTVDRINAITLTFYTTRGKVSHVVDALLNIASNTYDSANRLVQVTDPLGNKTQFEYDANGNKVTVIDRQSRRWLTTFDRLNRAVMAKDPLGNTSQTVFDDAGRVKQTISPRGFVSLNEYDGRSRLKKWTEAEGYVWTYDYDGQGNITNITDALNGHYVMRYDNRNLRMYERNQDNFVWQYVYDELGRVSQQTDPNGRVRTAVYDDGGRVDYVSFNTGRTDDFGYDDNNNVTLMSRSKPGDPPTSSAFVYDANNRVTEYTDPFNKKIKYGYDLIGRIIKLTYPDGKGLTNEFDSLSRLTNQVDWAGRKTSYAYDIADRLVRRVYPNGIVQTNSFDEAGRLTGLLYLTNSGGSAMIALNYAYDRNGNKTSANEAGTLDWPVPSTIDETSSFTPANRLISRADAVIASNNWAYAYDSAGNMTNVIGGGQSFAFAYDEDNRVTKLGWDSGFSTKIINNRYDPVGRRISRKLDGSETRYALDLSGKMERILCDYSNNTITAWYVHGPDLVYKVDATNGLICYHADAMGNVIALTDGGTNVVVKYAYTPYGRSIARVDTVAVTTPYQFIGSRGVMEELPELYFMRARYYLGQEALLLSTDPVRPIGSGLKPVEYAYCAGNPLSYSDPNGKSFIGTADDIYQALKGQYTASDAAFTVAGATLDIASVAVVGTAAAAAAPYIVAAAVVVETVDFISDWSDGEGFAGEVREFIDDQRAMVDLSGVNYGYMGSEGRVSVPYSVNVMLGRTVPFTTKSPLLNEVLRQSSSRPLVSGAVGASESPIGRTAQPTVGELAGHSNRGLQAMIQAQLVNNAAAHNTSLLQSTYGSSKVHTEGGRTYVDTGGGGKDFRSDSLTKSLANGKSGSSSSGKGSSGSTSGGGSSIGSSSGSGSSSSSGGGSRAPKQRRSYGWWK